MPDFKYRVVFRDELAGRRRKKRHRLFSFVLALIVLIAGGIGYVLFFSGWFSVKDVEISGNKEILENDIRNLVSDYLNKHYLISVFRPFSNIFFVSQEYLEAKLLESSPIIEKAEVEKDFANKKIRVEILEKNGVGVWCKFGSDSCFYFDESGVLFKSSPRFFGQTFLAVEDSRGRDFKLGDRFDDQELLAKIREAKEIIDKFRIIRYTNFFLPENSFDFWIKTQDGWPVYLDKEVDVLTQLVSLKKLLEEKLPLEKQKTLQYIDLRVNNRIYYK